MAEEVSDNLLNSIQESFPRWTKDLNVRPDMCGNIDGPRICRAEWSTSDREAEILYDILLYVACKKKLYKRTYSWNRYRLREQTYDFQGG